VVEPVLGGPGDEAGAGPRPRGSLIGFTPTPR
jgi:hypothetical protein